MPTLNSFLVRLPRSSPATLRPPSAHVLSQPNRPHPARPLPPPIASQVSVGRDHTISALIPGYVKYYMMPHNPKRGSLSPNLPNCRPRDWNWPADMKLPPTNRPLGWRKYVGVVLNRSDKLPRDEAKYGRERVFFGKQEGEVETGVFDFVPAGAEGEQGAREQGGFEKVREVKLVIPERPGRVVRGELLSAEEADLAEGKTVAA